MLLISNLSALIVSIYKVLPRRRSSILDGHFNNFRELFNFSVNNEIFIYSSDTQARKFESKSLFVHEEINNEIISS